ncbi:TonB-dependent receptor domain-containing protein [Aquamicrobium segne]|uniref:TonB-dependent receptor domain-containing protein n=1 Tax=Aquamicrobium segne TaxID=469547 RepID=A0ABW0GSV2_9HYPH
MNRTIFAAGACALALTSAAQAQSLPDLGGVTVLDTITVTTPLRRTSSLERTTSSVTVIAREEIERSAAADLASLLKNHTGVSVSLNGGMGAAGGASLRGTTESQTLVLVNGVRVAAATSASAALFNIPLESIERVEIAKGAHSAQYGADAIGGIINIITRQGGPCANGNPSCTTVTAGVMHPWGGTLAVDRMGRSESGWDYSFGGSLFGTRGYDFTVPSWSGHEPDDNGFARGSLHYSLSKDYDWGRIYSTGLASRARTQYDNKPRPGSLLGLNETERDTLSGKIGARLDHSPDWKSTLEFSAGKDEATNFRDGVAVENIFGTTRYGMLASTEKSFATGTVDHILGFGVEAYREEINSTGNYAVKKRDLAAVFSQYSLEFGDLTVDAGLRFDHNEQFGEATTYNIGASYAVLPELIVRASHGTGFRAPTFNDLYYDDPEIGVGSPDLRPERSRSWEAGVNWRPTDTTSLDVSVYRNRIKDQIGWGGVIGSLYAENLERVSITGLEVTLDHRFNDRWGVRASLDLRRPINEVRDRYVRYQDRFRASIEADFQATEKLWLKAGVFHVGDRFSNHTNTQRMPAYTTVDLSAIYSLDPQSQLKLSVENLFDEKYERIPNYVAPGRTINLSLSRTF